MIHHKTPISRTRRISGFLGIQSSTAGLLIMVVLLGMGERMAERFLPIYVMALGGGAMVIGLLQAMDNLLSALYSFPGGYLSDRIGIKRSLLVFYSRSFEWLIAAFILRGLKEFGEPTRKSLIMDLAPDNCKAGMFGLYYLIRDIVVAAAALGGAFLWQISPETNLVTAFLFGIIGTIGFAVFGRDLPVQAGLRKD